MAKLNKLIEKLAEREAKKYVYYDKYLDIELEIEKFTLIEFEKMNRIETKSKFKDESELVMLNNYEVIYKHVPAFRDEELLETYKEQIGMRKSNIVPFIYEENLEPILEITKYIQKEVYGLEIDEEKKN